MYDIIALMNNVLAGSPANIEISPNFNLISETKMNMNNNMQSFFIRVYRTVTITAEKIID